MKTLNEQHRLIKQGKGHKDVFLKEAKKQFPEWIRTAATYNETAGILKNKGIINENVISLEPINQLVSPPKPDYEIAFNNYLKEAKKKKDVKSDDAKAEEKEVSKQVKKAESKNFDRKNMENPDNLIFDQIMKGYYCEMKNEKNSKKTMEELKKIVLKNLTKDPIYYTKNGQFGEDGIGYETEVPGLGTPKEPKGKYKASGYGDLDKATKARLSESKLRKSINTLIREELGENTVDLKESHQPGDKVIYKGTKYEVVDEDEFIITLKDEEGNITKQNYNQFKQGEYKPDLQESKLREVINTLIREEFEGEGLDPNTLHNNKGHWTIPNKHIDNPQDISDYIEAVDGMSKAEAIDYLGDQGLSSSQVLKIVSKINYDIRDMFNQDPDVRIDRSDDIFENGDDHNNILYLNRVMDAIASNGDYEYADDALSNTLDNPTRAKLLSAVNALNPRKIDLYSLMDDYDTDIIEILDGVFKQVDDEFYRDFTDPAGGSGLESHLQESKLRNVINTLVKQQIQENVQKELQQIDKEAQFEILASKLGKIDAAIEKRQSQLDRLDEDEDLKNLTDKKKLKALGKDIKVLGKAKAKIEKELAKKDKSDQPQPEMIDDGMIDEAEGDVDDAKATADEMERAAKAAKQIGDTELFEDEVFFEELED